MAQNELGAMPGLRQNGRLREQLGVVRTAVTVGAKCYCVLRNISTALRQPNDVVNFQKWLTI